MSHDEKRPSMREMLLKLAERDTIAGLVELGIEAFREHTGLGLREQARTTKEDGPATIAEDPEPVDGLDRSMMVEALVVDGQICLLTPPNETVFGFMACEVQTATALSDLDYVLDLYMGGGAKDSQGIRPGRCVELIPKGERVYRLNDLVFISPRDHIYLTYGRKLPPGTKFRGFALGAIHPSKMGGAQIGTPAPGPRDKHF